MRLLSLLLLPGLALAQTGRLEQSSVPPTGVTLPPTSAALVDDVTALSVNPASLRFTGPGQLVYLHERNLGLGRDRLGDGLLLGTSLFSGVGVGLGFEWMRGAGAPDYRKTSLGLSLGSGPLSLGVGYANYSSDDAAIDRLSTFDLGLTLRPARFLSVGAVLKDVNAPTQGLYTLPRRYGLAVGVRPLGERLTLGADWLAPEGLWDQGLLTYTVRATIVNGVGVSAGLTHGLGSDRGVAVQVALTLDSAHLGLTYAGGGTLSGSGLDHVLAVRVSGAKYPAPRLGGGTVALVDLADRLAAHTSLGLSLLGASEDDPYLELMRWLDEATRDERLRGVVLKVSMLQGLDWARADELHRAVLRLRAAGKKVLAVLLDVDDKAYFVASAADEVDALPSSPLVVNGLAATVTYLGGTMEKLGVTWDVVRVGDYKTAPEQLTRHDLSPAERETVEALLDTQTRYDVERVTQARHLPAGRLQEAWGVGVLTARRAQELGLVDQVLLPENLDSKLESLVPGASYDPTYTPRDEREGRWSGRRRIAVVPILGNIAGGKSRQSPLGGELVAGAETVVLALERARRDPSVVAIVLRVDSGGGDVLASETMYHAVLEAKKSKPVIASMGDVAASGGYYAALGADEVWASPTTITGSIGVFYMKPALKGLVGDKLGVAQETLTHAPLSGLMNYWTPWTPEEKKAAQAWIDSAYDDFITQVAQARKLDKAKVDTLARGRVWTGSAALERGLVDHEGGLMEAIQAARQRAHVPADEDLELKVMGEAHGLFTSLAGEPGASLQPLSVQLRPPLPPSVQAFVREAGLTAPWMLEPGLKAALPFTLTVR